MRKKLLAIVMSLTIILVFMPVMAFAEEHEVTSIAFKPAEPMIVYDYYLKDECELTEDGYLYYPELIEGDSIEITYKDGTTATYKLAERDDNALWENDNDPDDVISMDDIFFGPACIPESAANNASFNFEIEYLNVTTSGTVVFKSNNVSKITYTPKSNAITLYKGVDEINEDGDTYFDIGNAYDYLYGFWNDKVMIEYNDGTPSETLALDEFGDWNYVIEKNGEYISLPEFQQDTPWAIGNTYEIFLKAKGKTDINNKITVKIEANPYKAFSFTQSNKFLYVFEADMLDYDSEDDEYVLQDANNVGYYGSEGDTLSFTLDDGSKVEFEYGRIENDPDYPHGWDGFVTTDASGNKSRPQREIRIQDRELRWKKDSDGHYINDSAKLTYMGAVSDKPMVSYAGYQVWFDPNGGDGNANMGVPIGMSVKEMPNDFLDQIQPSRSGYTFDGWYEKDPATDELKADPYDFNTKIYEETFLYAKWEKEHEWEDEYTVDIPATCTTDGSESMHCKDCEATKDSRVIPSLGHLWNSEPTVDKPATCTEEGIQSIHCARCNETQEASIIPPLGHQWNTTYTVDVPATESAAGSQSIHCSVCGAIKEGSTQTIAPLPPSERISLSAVKISKPSAGKKKITVKWKKVSKKNLKKISGIQIQVATDPDFTNIVKTETAGKKKTSKVIKGLQSKTKYYVRIRAYAADNHVSVWKSKRVKVK